MSMPSTNANSDTKPPALEHAHQRALHLHQFRRGCKGYALRASNSARGIHERCNLCDTILWTHKHATG